MTLTEPPAGAEPPTGAEPPYSDNQSTVRGDPAILVLMSENEGQALGQGHRDVTNDDPSAGGKRQA